ALGDVAAGEAPPRLHDREEERPEEEAEGGERDGVALLHSVLRQKDVGGERECAAEGGEHAEPVEAVRRALPDLDDEREAEERKGEREPDPPAYGPLHDEAPPDR